MLMERLLAVVFSAFVDYVSGLEKIYLLAGFTRSSVAKSG